MEKERITTCLPVYNDRKEGELIYQDAASTIERTGDRIIVKVMAPKETNWLQLNDHMLCSAVLISKWATRMFAEGKKNFADLPEVVRDAEFEAMRADFEKWNAEDPETGSSFEYTYFYDNQNWVMYENFSQYLFVYEMEIKDSYNLGYNNQLEALGYWITDDYGPMSDFLQSWYYRVNGHPQDREQ